jgi:hypothetical protein
MTFSIPITCRTILGNQEIKKMVTGLKSSRESLTIELTEILQQTTGSSGTPLQSAGTASKLTVEDSARAGMNHLGGTFL